MLVRQARVVGKNDKGIVLDVLRNKMCGCCSNLFCGENKPNNLFLQGYPDLNPGDKIELKVRGGNLVFLSLLLFFFPSVLLVGVIYILNNFFSPLASFVFSLFGLFIYLTMLKLVVIKRIKDKARCKVKKIL